MSFPDLRTYLANLERSGDLKRVDQRVDPYLEITEICRRSLKAGGPALLFTNVPGGGIVLGNLFGTVERVARALGHRTAEDLRDLGAMLTALKEPRWPSGLTRAYADLPILHRLVSGRPRRVTQPPCQECVVRGDDVDLAQLPISSCWPQDAGRLITFGLVVTHSTARSRYNIGVYRQQVLGRNRLIMRWLPHRGGAADYSEWRETFGDKPFPVAVAIGADPALLIAATAPIPDTLSEYQFAGLLRGGRTELVATTDGALLVPAAAEMILEGHILSDDEALEGPFGDHTGYYNSQQMFPVFTVTSITHRRDPIYHTSYRGRSPDDEPSVLAMALNEVFTPLLKQQFPEITDFYLPPEACSYRMAVVSIRKRYPGHARRIMLGIWSYMRQFTYTKFVIVTDDDINIRCWSDVIWALVTRTDPGRDTIILTDTPVDYLDFSSPSPGLGGKIGFDATRKLGSESNRTWGRPIVPDASTQARVAELCQLLGF